MKLEIHARTHVGKVREKNEDAFKVWTPTGEMTDDASIIAIADGMGGHPGGEVASRLAVEGVIELGVLIFDDDTAEGRIRRVFEEARNAIHLHCREKPELQEMGTTLTAVEVRDDMVHLGHVGDTRLYWFRKGIWSQVTIDHTVAQELVKEGRLDPEEAEEHPTSNVLTRCVGVCPKQHPDILYGYLRLQPDDCILLVTDGLTKTVHDETLAEMVTESEPEKAVDWMIQAALAAGAPDNVTVVLGKAVGEPSDAYERPDTRFYDLAPGWAPRWEPFH